MALHCLRDIWNRFRMAPPTTMPTIAPGMFTAPGERQVLVFHPPSPISPFTTAKAQEDLLLDSCFSALVIWRGPRSLQGLVE